MRFVKVVVLVLFIASISFFSACGDKKVEEITPENAEQKLEDILKEIEEL